MLKHFLKLAPVKLQNRNILYGTTIFYTTQQRLVEENAKTLYKNINLISSYSKEQEEKILQLINNCDLNELSEYKISKARTCKLLAWRSRYGAFNNLNDILSIESFDPKVTHKFFRSLLTDIKGDEQFPKNLKRKIFISPSINEDQREAIKTCVSVHVGVNSVTWCRLNVPRRGVNAPCLLTHWEHCQISEKKLHLNNLIQRCLQIYKSIPEADCYVFENPQIAQASNNQGSVEQQNINIQKAQVTAVINYALANRNSNSSDITSHDCVSNVFYLKRFLSARLFNHLVGTERVSSEATILNMMRTFYNTNEKKDFVQLSGDHTNFCSHVQFPMELRKMFSKSPAYCREFLGQTLLLNLTFVRLVLQQDLNSLAKVTKKSNAKQNEIKD